MGRYLDKLEDCKKEWNAHYNEIGAVAAFGDEKLCRLQFRIEQLSKELDENDECSECEGWGSIECASVTMRGTAKSATPG